MMPVKGKNHTYSGSSIVITVSCHQKAQVNSLHGRNNESIKGGQESGVGGKCYGAETKMAIDNAISNRCAPQ
jgi:hypothetical protein